MASPTGSGQQQTKYESETPSHGLRFAYKASRIFKARRPLRLSGRLGTLPFRLAPGTKCRQISELPNCEHTRELCPRGRPTSSHGRQSLPSFGASLPRSGTRAKEAGTNGAGIGDAPRRAIRGAKGNPNSLPRRAAVRPWSPKPSLLRRLIAPIRDKGEGSGHKWSRNQRRGAPGDSGAKGNPNSLRRRAAVRPWSPKRSVPRQLGAPIRDEAKEAGTNAAGISDAARRAIRGAKGNPNSLRRRAAEGWLRKWRRQMPPPASRPHALRGDASLPDYDPDYDPGLWSASVHHRRFEYADHRGVRWLPAQVADAMRHIAPIAQGLAAAGRRRRFADLDLEFAVQNRQALDRAAQMGGRIRERRPDRPGNRTIAASQRFSASRSRQDGIVRRRRRRSAWSLGRDAR